MVVSPIPVNVTSAENVTSVEREEKMLRNTGTIVVALAAAVLLGGVLAPVLADEALDKAFDTLKTYDWGQDRSALKPIDDAVAASSKDAGARKQLETRLAATLKTDIPQASKDFVCRKLSLVGSAECVPAVAPLLTDEKLSHMARYALERIPDPAAVGAMRDALGKVQGKLKVGVINSLGVRRDAKSTAALVKLLDDSDKQVAAAAAAALGSIGTPEAAKALEAFQAKAPKELLLAACDAQLTCAERLLAGGKKADALAIYKALSKPDLPKHVRVAGMRGMLAVAVK
jgi:HEAT repeat protein